MHVKPNSLSDTGVLKMILMFERHKNLTMTHKDTKIEDYDEKYYIYFCCKDLNKA